MSDTIETTLIASVEGLTALRDPSGGWTGRLSSSALSTATAVRALAGVDREGHGQLISAGLEWLAAHVNEDGGWGDTPQSKSNLPTTLLVWSAFGGENSDAVAGAESWLTARTGSLEPERIAAALADIYGADRTFAAPILTMCAISGRLGGEPEAWDLVPPLPFELAALPALTFSFMGLPVVSYALPALIAIGQARHFHRPSRNPAARLLRNLSRHRTLKKLRAIQPPGGGFLEAAPLTSFVAMSLASAGLADHPVTTGCVGFLKDTVRPDGSWPIDTNLSTWVTTLSVSALAAGVPLGDQEARTIADWLIDQHHTELHPYTRAAPGGWAWSPLSGAVPDADDTAGAMIALHNLAPDDARAAGAAAAGAKWLVDLQNRDGGIPTFCRGWGKLPFDHSCPDLTAHALAAWDAWRESFDGTQAAKVRRASARAVEYLAREQRDDGSWRPLWFGNEDAPDQANPTYGTARVLAGLRQSGLDIPPDMLTRGAEWLISAQNDDGGWGGGASIASSIEETALAVDALLCLGDITPTIESGAAWLVEHTGGGRKFPPAAIGLYFAKLWYYEELYPRVFTISALNRLLAKRTAIHENH
ncbi:MAG: squalene--hopene cyclase [Phycisphaerae bacterium]|nr:squalene--hopene cyclase [Phycisphaerae bacterium]